MLRASRATPLYLAQWLAFRTIERLGLSQNTFREHAIERGLLLYRMISDTHSAHWCETLYTQAPPFYKALALTLRSHSLQAQPLTNSQCTAPHLHPWDAYLSCRVPVFVCLGNTTCGPHCTVRLHLWAYTEGHCLVRDTGPRHEERGH